MLATEPSIKGVVLSSSHHVYHACYLVYIPELHQQHCLPTVGTNDHEPHEEILNHAVHNVGWSVEVCDKSLTSYLSILRLIASNAAFFDCSVHSMSWFSHGEWLDVSKKERRTFFRLMKSHVLIHTTVTNDTQAVYAFILNSILPILPRMPLRSASWHHEKILLHILKSSRTAKKL